MKAGSSVRRETRLALKLFVWKAHRLRDGRYLRFLQEQGGTKLTLSYTRGNDGGDSSVTIDHQRPDDDATDAFVLNFRFFIHGREQSSFGWLAKHVLDDPDLSDDWKQAFTSARDQVNTFLDSPSPFIEKVVDPNSTSADGPQLVDEYHWTNRQIMDVFINGGMAHAEVPKWETFERWRSNQLGFSPMLDHFDLIVTTVVHAIAFVCGWCEQ